MTEPPYKPAPFHGLQLSVLIDTILANCGTPSEARRKLTHLLEDPDNEFTPPLPPQWDLRMLADGGPVIEMPDGVPLDTTKVTVRPRMPGLDPSFVHERSLLAEADRRRTLAALTAAEVKEKLRAQVSKQEDGQPKAAQDNHPGSQPQPTSDAAPPQPNTAPDNGAGSQPEQPQPAEPPPSPDARERSEWKEFLIPLLNTLRDENQLPNKSAAFHAVNNCLIGRGLKMSKGSIYEGLARHHAEWWSPRRAK
jgi:hypothetical protein